MLTYRGGASVGITGEGWHRWRESASLVDQAAFNVCGFHPGDSCTPPRLGAFGVTPAARLIGKTCVKTNA